MRRVRLSCLRSTRARTNAAARNLNVLHSAKRSSPRCAITLAPALSRIATPRRPPCLRSRPAISYCSSLARIIRFPTMSSLITLSYKSASSESDVSEPERVGDHRHRAQTHRRARDNRAKQQAELRIKHARRDWDTDHVVKKGKEKILPDVAHRRAAQPPRLRDTAQVAFDQRDPRALHRDVGPCPHRDSDLRLRESRRVVDTVSRHRDDPALRLQSLHHRRFLIGHDLGLDLI